jgi:four helix bundle protein
LRDRGILGAHEQLDTPRESQVRPKPARIVGADDRVDPCSGERAAREVRFEMIAEGCYGDQFIHGQSITPGLQTATLRDASPGEAFAHSQAVPLGHEKLVAWQRADDLFVAVHRFAAKLPNEERFSLSVQMRRAAYSVPANIVEGMARRSIRDRLRFLNVAEASLAELAYCLHVCKRLGYLTAEEHATFEAAALQVGAPLSGLIRSLKSLPN